MAKITFRLGPGRDKTNVRIAKSYYPYKFIEYLKTKSDFEYKGTNRINHVFVYLGTVENAEFNLKAHYTVFKNMNKKLNQHFIEEKNKGELKIMNKKEFIGKVAFNVLQIVRKYNNEDQIENWNDLNQERKNQVLKTVEAVFNNPKITAYDMHDEWEKAKLDNGWKYAPVTDRSKKLHSCLVPFEALNIFQKMKDDIFIETVKQLISLEVNELNNN